MDKEFISRKIDAYEAMISSVSADMNYIAGDDAFQNLNSKLQLLKMSKRFGIPLTNWNTTQYGVVDSYDNWTCVRLCDGDSIHCSDDGKQPENEWLYIIRFPSGPYIFHSDRSLSGLFKRFFEELKAFGPKYCDTMNHTLYFAEDTSELVYNSFWDIFKKYRALVNEEVKTLRKKELELELSKYN